MTTNIEWLYENDRENLITMIAGDCDCCKFDSDCECGNYKCDRRWLEAEYEDPDGWGKIEEDLVDICDELSITYDPFVADKVYRLVYRCKKLAGVEQ